MTYLQIHRSDLEKILQALDRAHTYFRRQNEMNAALHLSDPVYSPLTTSIGNARTRATELLQGVNTGELPIVVMGEEDPIGYISED